MPVDRIIVVPGPNLAKAAQEWPEYRKTITVRAKQMEAPFEVETREGVMRGKANDYLVGFGAEGEFWPVGRAVFEATHERVAMHEQAGRWA